MSEQVISNLRQKMQIHYDVLKQAGADETWEVLHQIKQAPREQWPLLVREFFGVGPDLQDNTVAQTQCMALLNFEQSGQQTLTVGPHLQWGFERTDLSIPEFVKLPYEGFYVALPDCSYELWGGRTGWHQVQGVYVFRSHEEIIPGGLVRFYLWGSANENSLSPLDDASFFFGLTEHEFKFGNHGSGYSNMEDYFMYILGSPLRDESDFKTSSEIVYTAEVKARARISIQKVMRVVCNAMVYLTTYQPSLTTVGPNQQKIAKLKQEMARYNPGQNKYQRAQKKLKDLTQGTITYLNLPIESDLRCSRSHASPLGHQVRGHYKGQRYGKNHSLTRRRWIDPYPRGDLENMAPSRVYKGLENLT